MNYSANKAQSDGASNHAEKRIFKKCLILPHLQVNVHASEHHHDDSEQFD
jgi:hypothetical protein